MLDMIYQIYGDGLALSIIAGFIVMPIFLVVGVIRFFKRYAYAQPMHGEKDDVTDCSFVIRMFWCIEAFVENKPILEDEEICKPVGAAWQGTGLDMLLSGIIFLLIGLFWPVVLPCAAIYLPIQSMHNHHKNKREFLKKLEGNDEEASRPVA